MPPLYEFVCSRKHVFERVLPVCDYQSSQTCECGATARRILSIPAALIVQKDICYDSPVSGEIISSWKQRKEDLAKHGCSPYDPDIKQDYHRRLKEDEQRLEKSIDETVEREFEKMPARKKELLENELKSGVTVEPLRATVSAKPITRAIKHGR